MKRFADHRAAKAVPVPRRMRGAGGFTLIELMVAVALMSILGLMLIGSLRTAARIVATATSRGEAVSAATDVLDRIEADLTQMVAGSGGRLTAGRDPHGRPFLAFVRTLPEERTTAAGYWSGSDSDWEGIWNGMQHDGRFRAFGGTCEVVWLMDPTLRPILPVSMGGTMPDPIPELPTPEDPNAPPPPPPLITLPAPDSTSLYRAVLAPAGGTPFDLRTQRTPGFPGLLEDLEWWFLTHEATAPEVAGADFRAARGFDQRFHLVTDRILHLGVEFWNGERPGWRDNNPVTAWETSTVASDGTELPTAWPLWRGDSSTAPRGLDFPRAVLVSVTVSMKPPLGRRTNVMGGVTASDTMVRLLDADGFTSVGSGPFYARVGQEWIEYRSVSGNTLMDCRRGARGTIAMDHTAGTVVETGLTMSRIITLPAGR